MATLRITNMPDGLYRKLRQRAEREHRSIAQQATHLLRLALEPPKPLSILDLRGLGKEHWKDTDPADHVRKERTSWD